MNIEFKGGKPKYVLLAVEKRRIEDVLGILEQAEKCQGFSPELATLAKTTAIGLKGIRDFVVADKQLTLPIGGQDQ